MVRRTYVACVRQDIHGGSVLGYAVPLASLNPIMSFSSVPPRPTSVVALAVLLVVHLSCASSPPPTSQAEAVEPAINAGLSIVAPADTTTPQSPIRQLSVAQEQARFVLPPGYRITPVLTEPHIKEPAAIAFDGNGRMFVLELRSYMQDANATGELAPVGRVSVHEDADNDGSYEQHSVFVDSLVFPRFVMPYGPHSILTMESNEDEVYRYTDTNHDGVADERTLFTTHFGRPGNVEHQQAFLFWGMDNWLYSTYNAFRVRWDGVGREGTGTNHAQWGVTQDNEGKIWFQGGASGHPSYFQFPIVYGRFDVEDQFESGFEVPYGLAGVGDYQPGPRVARTDGTLNRVTGAAGNDVFRGHRLPDDLVGDYLYGEPVARIVRRTRPLATEGLTQLRNVYQPGRSEFIRSMDPLFRPVDMATAPDGTLYIVDMYRGIIQQGTWTPPGSFLRAKIEQYNLDEAIGHGRIWRVTYDGMPRDSQQPRMFEESSAELVQHLSHPNGWWRDTAQQLLVLRQDHTVVPQLEALARTSDHRLARYHALWTLEGLGTLSAELARTLLHDPDSGMRIQALRASETLYKAGDYSFAEDYRQVALSDDADVALQAMMSLNTLDVPDADASIRAAMAAHSERGVQTIGTQILEARAEPKARWGNVSAVQQAQLERGATIYGELCAQCHGDKGQGTAFQPGQTLAPSLIASPRVQGHRDYIVQTLLHGLHGPIDEATYPGGLMVAMGENDDEWIAAVASFVRKSFENEAPLVTPDQVSHTRARTAERSTPYTYEELTASVPKALVPTTKWTVSASHNSSTASNALNFGGWHTEVAQAPGMWFQVEMPTPVTLTELQFDAPAQRKGRRDNAVYLPTIPQAYQVNVSLDGEHWHTVAEGQGEGASATIPFDPVSARWVRIRLVGPSEQGARWAMRQLRLYAAPEAQ
ncbi:MAG: hypothetical protein RhofKO_29840 [Rhodothermales bacterium]